MTTHMVFESPETIGFIDMLLAPYGLLSKSSHRQQVRGFFVLVNVGFASLKYQSKFPLLDLIVPSSEALTTFCLGWRNNDSLLKFRL